MVATKVRFVRVDECLWLAAKCRAKRDGTNVSVLIRQWLTEYISRPPDEQEPDTA